MNKRVSTSLKIIVLASVLPVAFIVQELSAQEHEATNIPGEWVISESSAISALMTKNLSTVAEASNGVAVVVDAKPHVALIRDKKGDLCRKVRMLKRRQKIENSRHNRALPIRRVICEPNAVMQANQESPVPTLIPNDPLLNQQWGFLQSNGININMPAAWAKYTGSKGIVVAVIDTGIDYNHPDLIDNIWTNEAEVAGNGIDDDANGFVDDIHGYNFVSANGNPMDDHGHGTHCAGVIGAMSNNAQGVAGINWKVQLVAVKFLGASGSGSLWGAIQSIDYVTSLKKNKNLNIILSSNSWGGGGYLQSLKDAILRANDADILFVAAAGNSAQNNDVNPAYPASYGTANLLSVAAIDSNGNLASFSNYGVQSVDIAAPGVSVASTYKGGGYVYMSGTSMAAPHVSGVLALFKSMSRELRASQLKDALLNGARPLSSLIGRIKTGAMVNAYNSSLLLPWNPLPPDEKDPYATPTPTPTPTYTPTPIPTLTPTPIPTPGYYDLSGTVSSAEGKKLQGVRLTLQTSEPKTYLVLSDANGFFRFNNIYAPTDYTLDAAAAGHVFNQISGRFLRDSSISIQSRAERKFTLSVKVITSTLRPVSGVTIDAGLIGSAMTNSAGMAYFNLSIGTQYSLVPMDLRYTFADGIRDGSMLGDVTRIIVAEPKSQ